MTLWQRVTNASAKFYGSYVAYFRVTVPTTVSALHWTPPHIFGWVFDPSFHTGWGIELDVFEDDGVLQPPVDANTWLPGSPPLIGRYSFSTDGSGTVFNGSSPTSTLQAGNYWVIAEMSPDQFWDLGTWPDALPWDPSADWGSFTIGGSPVSLWPSMTERPSAPVDPNLVSSARDNGAHFWRPRSGQ